MKSKFVKKMTLSAMFLAMAVVFAMVSNNIPEIGNMLCPMHIPVIICGFLLGWKYAFFVGFLAPYLKFVLTGMPVLYPNCIAMSFELATYGLLSGLLFKLFNRLFTNKFVSSYSTLIPTMLIGRVVWGLATFILLLFDSSKTITFVQYLKSAFVYSLPGILLQLCFIPVIVYFLLKTSVFNNLIEESK